MRKTILFVLIMQLAYSCSRTSPTSDESVLPDILRDTVPDTNKYQPVPPAQSFANVQLRVDLDEIHNSDQGIRNKYIALEKKYGYGSKEVMAIANEWRTIDSINLIKVTDILDKYGWIGSYEIGEQANMTLFLVIQHSDYATMNKYLPMMRKAVRENKAEARHFALLQDRVLIGHGKKQVFGSQLEMDTVTQKYKFSPIEDEPNVNKRRASVGLGPLEEYAKGWEIKYVLPKK